jgi:hypothetical protein
VGKHYNKTFFGLKKLTVEVLKELPLTQTSSSTNLKKKKCNEKMKTKVEP